MEFNIVIEKIKDIISNEMPGKTVFEKDVANALGMTKLNLAQFKCRNKIPVERVIEFCAKRKISINWILYDQIPESLLNETNKYVRIKHYSDINASAGGGCFNYDEDFIELMLDEKIIKSISKSNNINYDNVHAINVIGDSMEPILYDKDIILFDNTKKDFSRGGIFVVSTNSGLFVKRLNKKINGSIELISENKIYPSENIDIDELDSLNIIGKVIGKVGQV